MASTLQKLLRKTPATRIIAALHSKQAPNLRTAPVAFQQTQLGDKKQGNNLLIPDSNSILDSLKLVNSSSSHFLQIYPSFPLSLFFTPISPAGSVPSETENMDLDDSRSMWADSVKKKRKRKMNKHKYKKLRKRLRRKT